MIVFAPQNLVSDPPFSRLDLVICRNLLIYINPDVQKRILPLFHQVLKPGGFLFLGTSETIGNYTDLFNVMSKKWKIYQRLEAGRKFGVELPITIKTNTHEKGSAVTAEERPRLFNPGQIAERLLVQRYSPPCVVINEDRQVLYYSTRTARFLEPPVGEPSQDILRMAREDLRPALRAAISKAFESGEAYEYEKLRINLDGEDESINLRVEPIEVPVAARGMALVVFETAEQKPLYEIRRAPKVVFSDDEKDRLIVQLEEQLQISNDELQATIERLETANEELKSTNEELMSMNEEFQSTNEELETSKEELQALNEELVTVNSELESMVEELGSVNNDMLNLLNSSEIATIFLDRQLTVKLFTPYAEKLFSFIAADVGRPLEHLSTRVHYPDLMQDVQNVLQNLKSIEKEISTDEDTHYLLRILPYRTFEDTIEGVVITCFDLSSRRQAEELLRKSNAALLETQTLGQIGTWELDIANNILVWTEENCRIFGVPPGTTANYDIFIEKIHPEDRDYVNQEWTAAIQGEPYDIEHRIEVAGETRWVREKAILTFNAKGDAVSAIGFTQDITERKHKEEKLSREIAARTKVEAELVQSVNKYRALYENAPLSYQSLDQQGCFLDVNPAWLRTLGYEREEVIGKCYADFLHPDWQPHFEKNFPEFKRRGYISNVHFKIRHKDGYFRDISFEGCIGYNPDGSFRQTYCVFQDITDRVQAEELLKSSEKKFRRLVETTKAIPWEFDLQEGVFIYVGKQLKDLLGGDAPPWQTLSDWAAAIHPEDRESAVDFCLAETKEGRDHIFEYRILTLAGEIRWVVDYVSVQFKNEKPAILSGLIFDVSELKEATELLRASEEKVRLIINATAEGIYGVNLDQECTFFNLAARTLLGYEESHLLGRNPHDLIAHSDQNGRIALLHCRVADVLATGTPCHNDNGIFWKSDGSYLNVEYNIHPIKNKGLVEGAVITFLDISDKKKLLEQRIRSGQLSSLGELAAGVAHEINNPINGIINYAQILANKEVERDKQKQILNNIMKEGKRIAVIVGSLLKYAHKDRTLMTGLDLSEIVYEPLQLLQQQLLNDGLFLEVDLDEALPKVFGNVQKLEQVILNLVSNARHALNEKYPTNDPNKILQISAKKTGEGDSARVRLTVWDQGIGIPKENQVRIFNRFFTTKPAGVGTGLGLSITHDILEEHGAVIDVKSEAGLFTKVTIDFPLFKESS